MKNENLWTTLLALIGGLMIVPIMLFYGAFSWGYVSLKAYNWFILTNWINMPNFTLIEIISIKLVIGVFFTQSQVHLKKEFKDEAGFWFSFIFLPWITLVLLWILNLFI